MRRSTESPDNNPSMGRMTSPSDQWQTRSVSPRNIGHNYGGHQPMDSNVRSFASNASPNQRLFGPNGRQFPLPNQSAFPSFTPNSVQDFNYDNNYPNYESYDSHRRSTPSAPMYPMQANTSRPIYTTPNDPVVNQVVNSMKDEEYNLLKTIVLNQSHSTSAPKPESPESTSDDSTEMDRLIEQMKRLTEEEDRKKRTRRDIETQINALDEELKAWEKTIALRDDMKKIKAELESDEQRIERQRKVLIEAMDKCNKRQQLASSEGRSDSTDKPEEKSTKGIVDSNVDKASLKRPVSTSSKPNSILKKVRINSEICYSSEGSDREVNKCLTKTTPKPIDKPPVRRTPITPKASATSTGPQSTKTSAISRHRTPTSNATTSGVKTSRPMKISCSRSKARNEGTEQTPEPIQTAKGTESQKPIERPQTCTQAVTTTKSNKSTDSLDSTERPSSDVESDNEVFDEVSKCIAFKIDSEPPLVPSSVSPNLGLTSKSSQSLNPTESVEKVSETTETEQNSDSNDKSGRELTQTSGQEVIDNIQNPKETNDTTNCDNSAANEDKVIAVIDIDSDDENYTSEPQQVIRVKEEIMSETERQRKVIETVDNVLSDQSRNALNPRSSHTSTDSSDRSEEYNTSGEESCPTSAFKRPSVPTAPVINRKQLKYTSFEAIEYEPTVNYSISSFKPIAGPKSKSLHTSAIAMKSFQNYLFASFVDSSVRRFHIENKSDVVKFEGHESLVFSMIVVNCPKSADTFILYTGSKDKKVRAFDAISGLLLNSIELKDEILCLHYNWSHIFAGLQNGMVCKIVPIHETSDETSTDSSGNVKDFVVNSGKKILAIIPVKPVLSNGADSALDSFEPLIAVSINKLRVVNTSDSARDAERILHSIAVAYSPPVFVETFGNYLFVSHKIPFVKTEEKTNENKSRLLVFDLQAEWKAIISIDVLGLITGLALNKSDLILICFNGKIQCIDCTKLELKWITYSSHVMTGVRIGDRLVVANRDGQIDCIYLDQHMIDCQTCGVTFARQKDFKEHIQLEHKIEDQSVPEVAQQSTQ